MEYHKIFENHEQDTFNKSGVSFKETLINGRHKDLNYNRLRDHYLNVLDEKTNRMFPNSDKEFQSIFTILNKRSQIYDNNDPKSIFKNELVEKYNNSSIKKKITYEELAIKLGVYTGLKKSYATISNHTNYFTMLYKFSKLENFIFTDDANKLNEYESELRRECYPENNANINITKMTNGEENSKEESNDIILHGIEFNLYEFALYQREWKDCNSQKTSLREVYDKVLMDFNDPYNYGGKRYDTTTFYRILKEDYIRSKQSFDVCLAYEKVEKLVDKTNNKVFKVHIKEKLETARFKLRVKSV